jgi:hypothetical protein
VKRFIKNIALGSKEHRAEEGGGTLRRRAHNILSIWNNEHHDDFGIEKVLRLILAISQFLFLGTYLKELFGKLGRAYSDLSIELFVILKAIFPVLIIYCGWQDNMWLFYLMTWFLVETMLYVPTLIFASDLFSKPRSYRRSMLLLFINYLEIVFSFGVFYARGNYLNKPFTHWFDSIYFSFVTSVTIGFSDYYPVSPMGKFLVSAQSLFFLMFVVLFINFFSNKVEIKGYFDRDKS